MAAPINTVLLRKIEHFALLTRVGVIFLQVLFNSLVPDHEASVFNPPSGNTEEFFLDQVIGFSLGGFRRWDAIYFTHISEFGYTYENTLAFFPVFPVLVKSISRTVFFPLQFCMTYKNVILIASVAANMYFFVKSVKTFYELGRIITANDIIAYKGALLFCVSPASVFMSAPYSETLFAYITITSLLKLAQGKKLSAAIYIGLSCATRSNGLLNIGYLAYEMLKETLKQLKLFKNIAMMKVLYILSALWIFLAYTLVPYLILSLICVLPFLLYQFYCFRLYCTKDYKLEVPEHLVIYGISQGCKLPYDEPSPWCNSSLPLAYSYVQTKYWDQGFLRYWEIKQIPNFILATPVTVMVVSLAANYFKHNRYVCLTLGLDEDGAAKKETPTSQYFQMEGVKLLPYVLHAVVLTVFSWFFIHIQVLTRLLFSSTFVLYWYGAHLISEHIPRQQLLNKYNVIDFKQINVERPENLNHPFRNLFTDQMANFTSQNFVTRCLLLYFIGYYVVGVALFSNFLPWT